MGNNLIMWNIHSFILYIYSYWIFVVIKFHEDVAVHHLYVQSDIIPDSEQVMCKIYFPIPNRPYAMSIFWSRTGHMQMSFPNPEQVTCMCHFLIPNRSHARSISWSRSGHMQQGLFPDPNARSYSWSRSGHMQGSFMIIIQLFITSIRICLVR